MLCRFAGVCYKTPDGPQCSRETVSLSCLVRTLINTELCLQVCRLVLKESTSGVPESLGARLVLRTVDNIYNIVLPCRFAGLFSRSPMVEFQDDWETVSPSAGTGTRLLRQELDNHSKGLPPGLTAMPTSRGR